jgi:short-subunit dehydrogenase
MSIIIVGAGANLGAAVARRFGREGLAVGLVARTQSKLDDLAAQLATDGITAKGAAADIRGPLEFSVLGAVAAATAVLGTMLERGSGTILFTTGGAAINPYPLRAGVGISFAGEVAYARMLYDEVSERGVHVAHTAIGGSIAPGTDNEPDDIAELLWRHHAERGEFQTRVGIDR